MGALSVGRPRVSAVSWRAPEAREHEFSTGRRAVIDTSLPMLWLADQARMRGDDAAVGAFTMFISGDVSGDNFADLIALMHRDIVEHAWRRPRVVLDEGLLPDPVPVDADGVPEVVAIRWLADAEIVETVGLVLEGVADAARFRGDGPRGGGGADSAGVGRAAKRPARAKTGKP